MSMSKGFIRRDHMTAPFYKFDAVLFRSGAEPRVFYGASDDPAAKAASLLECLKACQPGWTDLVQIGLGKFDATVPVDSGPGIVWPDQVTIKGMGRKATHLYGTIDSDNQGAMFTPQNNEISDLTMEAMAAGTQGPTVFVQSDPRTLGFDFQGNVTKSAVLLAPPPYCTRLYNCNVKGPAWTVYSWSPNNTLIANFCDFYGGRHCAGGYDSGVGQNYSFYNCRFFGDPTGIFSVGAISQVKAQSGVFGIVWMGGNLKVIDCEMNLIGMADLLDPDGGGGWSRTRRVCGITDSFGYAGSAPALNTKIEVAGLRCSITPNGSDPAQCFDLDIKHDYVRAQMRIDGRKNPPYWPMYSGSAADGSLTKSW